VPDAGLDIDFDGGDIAANRELARIQAVAAAAMPGSTMDPPPGPAANGNGKAAPAETVELLGRHFRIAEKIGLMPLLKFSAYADVATNDPRALGAMYAMLRDCIHPGHPGCGECEACAPDGCGDCDGCDLTATGTEGAQCSRNTPNERACKEFDAGDWAAFEDHAMATRAEAEDLFDVISKVMELIAGRPTRRPGSSSPGPRRTRGGSTGGSSSRRGKASRR
jgi:hypothetical protein